MLFLAVPPLSNAQRTALDTSFDGRDHRESAFDALLENARQWSDEIGDAPVRLEPVLNALVESPDAYRGDLCRIDGRIEQIEWLREPWLGVATWFVRTDAEAPLLVYLTTAGEAQEHEAESFRAGERITVFARFYKRIDSIARDGEERSYAAFVGSISLAQRAPRAEPPLLGLLVPAIAVLGLVFVIALVLARRARGMRDSSRRMRVHEGLPVNEPAEDLPDDPAAALDVLRRRRDGL